MKCPACDKEMVLNPFYAVPKKTDLCGVGTMLYMHKILETFYKPMPLGQYYCPYCQYTDEPDDEGPQFGDH